jgi:hypothetical protein
MHMIGPLRSLWRWLAGLLLGIVIFPKADGENVIFAACRQRQIATTRAAIGQVLRLHAASPTYSRTSAELAHATTVASDPVTLIWRQYCA